MSQRRNHNENQKIFFKNNDENMAYPFFQGATKTLLKENVQLQMYMLENENG